MKIVTMLLVICLSAFLCQVVSAAGADLEQAPDYYDAAHMARVEQLKTKVENMLGINYTYSGDTSPQVV